MPTEKLSKDACFDEALSKNGRGKAFHQTFHHIFTFCEFEESLLLIVGEE